MSLPADVQYAGFGRRLAACLIDTILLLVVLAVLGALLGITPQGSPELEALLQQPEPDMAELMAALAAQESGWDEWLLEDLLPAVIIILLWVRFGATPGKRLLDCEVVMAESGEHPRLGSAVLRYIGYFVSLLPLGLGFLWILWDKRKQGFHDKMAGTVVIMRPHGIEQEHDREAEKSLEQLMKDVK